VIKEAAETIRSGGLVGVPTDTVYGLAADPRNEHAVGSLYRIKGRPADKPIALLTASVDAAAELVKVTDRAAHLMKLHWPGPLTVVMAMRIDLPQWLGDQDRRTVAVRMPSHPVALDLLSRTGPLAVTSANRTGADAATNESEAEDEFGSLVDVYLPGTCPGGESSTVVDLTVDPPVLLRAGPVPFPLD
jgi:L-threonylcarbamoyladenylate synthase